MSVRLFCKIVDKFAFCFAYISTKRKRKMKDAFKNSARKGFFKVVLPIVLIAVFAVTLATVLRKLPEKPQTTPDKHYRGVVELWNVETFEGGSGSRSSWLTSRAAKFEKTHEGFFVHVTDLSVQQLKEKLDCGETFDVICFSRGVGCLVQSLLQPYSGSVKDVKENLLASGRLDGKVFALPLYVGGYFLFARQSQLPQNADLISVALTNSYTRKVGKTTYELQPLLCGFTPYNSPLSALAMSGGRGKTVQNENVTQYAAYESFLANKTAVTLLGTQRDLYRLTKREESGKMEKLVCRALTGYTDLVQYLALSATCQNVQCCTEFLQFAISEAVQQTLTNVSMFSVLEQTYYTSVCYAELEKGLASAYVPNVFADSQALTAQRNAALKTLEM